MCGRSFSRILLSFFLLTVIVCNSHIAFAALDPPHDGSSSVTCVSCHDLASSDSNHLPQLDHTPIVGDMDDTLANNLCWSCHKDINKVGEACLINSTHSSQSTTGDKGNWSVSCPVCHNQHTQEQDNAYNTSYGKYIRREVDLARIAGQGKSGKKTVKFIGTSGADSFADGSGPINGICEVCHEQTDHYRNDGSGTDQNHSYIAKLADKNPNLGSQQNCVFCHNHKDGFRPSCPDCHGFPPTVASSGGPDGLVGPGNVRQGARYAAPATTGSATTGQHVLHATPAGYDYPCHTCHFGGMSMSMTGDNPDVDNMIQIGFGIDVDDFTSYPSKKFLDGMGTSYDGQAALAGKYEGTNSTAVTAGNAKKCANVYCHTDGKLLINDTSYGLDQYPPRYTMGNISPPWDDPGYDPQNNGSGDGNKCNNCHDYPPRYDAHEFHFVRGITCVNCHGATTADDVSISDRSRHANGVYDVVAGGYVCQRDGAVRDAFFRSVTGPPHHTEIRNGNLYNCYTHSLTYIPAGNGGTCSNLQCHQAYQFSNPIQWQNKAIPQYMLPPGTSYTVTSPQCGIPGTNSATLDLSFTMYTTTCQPEGGCESPFDFNITDWNDGKPATDPAPGIYTVSHAYDISYNPACDPDHVSYNPGDPSCPVNPTYNPTDPACNPADPTYDRYKRSCYPILIDYPDRKYFISWTTEDAEGIALQNGPQTTPVVICPQANIPPESETGDFTISAPGGFVLNVTVSVRDQDYNKGSHNGPGKIKIDWGGYAQDGSGYGITIADLPMTNTYSSHTYSFSYDRSAFYWVKVTILDNDPQNSTWVSSGFKSVKVN